MTAPMLPAVVVGIDSPIGLTIVRDLGQDGIDVIGIGRSKHALGMASRYLTKGLVRPREAAGLIDQLADLGHELGRACLFAVSENDIALLNRHRARLSAYTIMFADEARMNSVLNKDQTYRAAASVGVRTPRTEQAQIFEEVERFSQTLRFPVVLKWANPHEVAARLSAARLALNKTRYCHSPQELLDYLRPYQKAGVYPLVQEYCAGYGLGQFILMKDGQPHYTFQHRRLHEWPPEGGFSSMCESLPADSHQALMARSVALLRALNWEGIAMVEYRHDPATGESALMEINGRFWGSLPLARHAGARFPSIMHALASGGNRLQTLPYRAGVRCRYMIPETRRLLRILFAQHKIADKSLRFDRIGELAGYLADFVRPDSRYYVFSFDDARPFFNDLRQILGKAASAVTQRLPGLKSTPAPGK
ncbi:carboxylate--amine ligase [Massilia puerhi]|uniref:carboxylate--amine ligase n=1 Tax=Massilia puerhi TaxID=2681550 RepID=UPI001357382B|nr:carboxylate--amine ligase [Massilia puerhi]